MNPIVLNNRYQLLQRIGVGGMAYVYEAEDLVLRRRVAVKVLKEQFIEDQEFVTKFEKEAQAAASLSHPNIVNVYDVGFDQTKDRPYHYIVMELIEGTTLKDAIRAHGGMTSPVIARTGRQIARALECAHDHDIVHRDVKPANILITKSGDIKVADFGIARISSSSTVTFTNNILGTVHYISPEQAKGELVDEKSDIYSLGVVLYEMATGHVPFDADTAVAIAVKHIQEKPVPPIEQNPSLHVGMNHIILKCLEKDPMDRYLSAGELAEALDNYNALDDTLLLSVTQPLNATDTNTESEPKEVIFESQSDTPPRKEEKNRSSLRSGLMLAALAVITFLFGAVYLLFRNDQKRVALVSVPAVINMKEEEALERLERSGLVGEVTERRLDEKVEAGIVIDQSIMSGTSVQKGTKVDLSVSVGRTTIPVPDVRNQSPEEASQTLIDAGFKVGKTEFIFDDNVPKDKVIGTEPDVGTEVENGSRINILVSQGKQKNGVIVPVLVNQEQNQAIQAITDAGLQLGSMNTEFSSYPSGIVIYQSIEPGVEVEKQTSIDITVSSGQRPEESTNPEESQPLLLNLRLYPTPGKDSVELTVYDLTQSQDQPIFQKTFSSAEANAEGYIPVQVEAREGGDFSYYIDGVPADFSASENGDLIEETTSPDEYR